MDLLLHYVKLNLKKFFPTISDEIEDVLWYGFSGSVVVINGEQKWIRNKNYGIKNRNRPTKSW